MRHNTMAQIHLQLPLLRVYIMPRIFRNLRHFRKFEDASSSQHDYEPKSTRNHGYKNPTLAGNGKGSSSGAV
jgi:hypothetical protein